MFQCTASKCYVASAKNSGIDLQPPPLYALTMKSSNLFFYTFNKWTRLSLVFVFLCHTSPSSLSSNEPADPYSLAPPSSQIEHRNPISDSSTSIAQRILKELTHNPEAAGLFAVWKVERSYICAAAIKNTPDISGELLYLTLSDNPPPFQSHAVPVSEFNNWRKTNNNPNSIALALKDLCDSVASSDLPSIIGELLQTNIDWNRSKGDMWRPVIPKALALFKTTTSLFPESKKLPLWTTASARRSWSWQIAKATIPVTCTNSTSLPSRTTIYFLSPPKNTSSLSGEQQTWQDIPPQSLPYWIQIHHPVRPMMMPLISIGWLTHANTPEQYNNLEISP